MEQKEDKKTIDIELTLDTNAEQVSATTVGEGSVTTDSKSTAVDPVTGREYYTSITMNPFTYTDVGGGSKKELNDAFLYNLVKDRLLADWVEVANGCFIEAADASSIYYNFPSKFNESQKANCFGDIRKILKCPDPESWGSYSRDSLHCPGLKTVNSLKTVRQEVAESVHQWIDHAALKTSDVLNQGPKDDSGERHALYEMLKIGEQQEDEACSPVIYTYVTSISELDSRYSNRYIYDVYGIAFYEFTPRAIMADDLVYKSACDDCDTPEEAKEKGKPGFSMNTEKKDPRATLYKNGNQDPISASVTRGMSESAEVTTSSSFGKTYSFGQKIGASIEFRKKLPFFGRAHISGSVEINFEQTLSETESTSATTSNEYNGTTQVEIPLKPHTAVTTNSFDTDTMITEEFDTPTAISYKVCIFAMTGKCYADNAAICDFKSYDHGYYINIVGADSQYGISAPENLYQRVIESPKSRRKDSACGAPVVKWTDTDFVNNDGVNWGSSYFTGGAGQAALLKLCTNIPMLSGGCKYDLKYSATEYTIGETSPLYLPEKFVKTSGDVAFEIKSGDKLNITEQIAVDCLNRFDVQYAMFDPKQDGEWVLCDVNGTEIASSNVIDLVTTGAGDQTITGIGAGTAYVIFNLKKGVEYKACDDTGVVTRESHLPSPIITITVDNKAFKGTVKVEGEFSGCVGDIDLNLNTSLKASAYDQTQKKVSVPIVWEAQELPEDGVTVQEDGGISFTKEGKYHVRAAVRNSGADDVYSDWVEITANPAR